MVVQNEKPFWQSKTWWINTCVLGVSVLYVVAGAMGWTEANQLVESAAVLVGFEVTDFPPGVDAAIITAANVVLRRVTKDGIYYKEPDQPKNPEAVVRDLGPRRLP